MKNFKLSTEAVIIAVLIFLFILLGIAKNYVSSFYKVGQGFEWEARAQTSNGLPVMFAEVNFHHSGYYGNSCEQNVMLYGDSTDRGIQCGGGGTESNDLYPDSLKILYYSFSESKFYAGAIKLNYDSLQTIATKMRKAVQSEEEASRTQSIIFKATVYPMGKVVVTMESYISTAVGEVIIAQFKAKPEEHDWSVFNNGNSSNSNASGVSESTSVATQRALLLNTYNWQVEMLLPKNHSLLSLSVNVFGNKSLEMYTLKKAKLPTFGNFLYMPQDLSVSWQRMDTIEFSSSFEFDEQEIIKAFAAIAEPGSKQPITMQIIAKDDTTGLKAILRGAGKNFTLKNLGSGKVYDQKIYH
jgi:hypothetical protein